VNGRWVAVLDENHYSFVEVEPGPLRICYLAIRNRFADATSFGRPGRENVLLITAEAGRKYFLRGENHPVAYEMGEDEWKALAARFTYVTFEPRPR
jgi:hypothetical protein